MDRVPTKTLPIYASVLMITLVCVTHYQLARIANQIADGLEDWRVNSLWITNLLIHDAFYYWFIPLIITSFFLLHQLGYVKRFVVAMVGILGTFASIILFFYYGFYVPVFVFSTYCVR